MTIFALKLNDLHVLLTEFINNRNFIEFIIVGIKDNQILTCNS